MKARMDNPAMSVPGAFEALQALAKAGAQGGLPQKTILLVLLRASQINGCSVCAHMHARDAKKAGETDELYLHELWRMGYGGGAPTRAQQVAAEAHFNFRMVEVVMMMMLPVGGM